MIRLFLALLYIVGIPLGGAQKPTLYVANFFSDNISVFDITAPQNPQLLMTVATNSLEPFVLVINPQQTALYVGNRNSNDISVFDLSDPQFPVLVKLVNTTSNGCVAIATNFEGTALYCANGTDVSIYDITNPLDPIVQTPINVSPSTPQTLTTHPFADVLYVGVASGINSDINVYNISSPFSPSLATTVSNGTNNDMRVMGIPSSGGSLYVTNGVADTISVYDITTPLNPSVITTSLLSGGSTAGGIAINPAGNLLCISNRTSGLIQSFDITNPNAIVVVSTISSQGLDPLGMIIEPDATVLYVAQSGDNNIGVFSLSPPNTVTSPVFIQNIADPGSELQFFAIFYPRPIPPPESPLAPPQNLQGCTKKNDIGVEYSLFNHISWTLSSSKNVAGYTIYRNGIKIASVGALCVAFNDFCVARGSCTVYTVQAFDQNGNVSAPIFVRVGA